VKVLKTPIRGRPGAGTGERYEFGPFRLDCATRELWRGDQLVALTPKAFDLLRVLVTSGGRAVEKNELMKLVWPDSFVGEDSLTQNIATLRKALGDALDRPQYIVTVPRHGYRFAAAVQAVSNGERSSSPPFDRTSRARWTRGSVAFSTVAALVATGLALAYFRGAPSSTPAVLRFVVTPPEGTTFSPSASFLAVSPNGRFLAFLASRPGGGAAVGPCPRFAHRP
jgi:DNA-binding winged helix-turn-helix (wHTH) protein